VLSLKSTDSIFLENHCFYLLRDNVTEKAWLIFCCTILFDVITGQSLPANAKQHVLFRTASGRPLKLFPRNSDAEKKGTEASAGERATQQLTLARRIPEG
jgi:hypothetical protein